MEKSYKIYSEQERNSLLEKELILLYSALDFTLIKNKKNIPRKRAFADKKMFRLPSRQPDATSRFVKNPVLPDEDLWETFQLNSVISKRKRIYKTSIIQLTLKFKKN